MSNVTVAVIQWTDSASSDGWHDLDTPLEPISIITAGILMAETENYITIRRSQSDSDMQDGVFSIPRFAIKEFEKIEVRL